MLELLPSKEPKAIYVEKWDDEDEQCCDIKSLVKIPITSKTILCKDELKKA